MNNAETILKALDARLEQPAELTLYGRAALQLGFSDPPEEYAISQDVDAVLWFDQAEELATHGNFWEAVDAVNQELAESDLYISHFFEESQVVLLPDWREHRIPIGGTWTHLRLYRLGDTDLLLSKLMRNDPIDLADARFILKRSGLRRSELEAAVRRARVPAVPEIRQQFASCVEKLLSAL